jgi:DNA-binding SARP family transcriptional activator
MDFCILGPLEVLDEDRAVALAGARQRALLALFVLHVNETLTNERLIDELWGERPPCRCTFRVCARRWRGRRATAVLGWW